jgi:gas vesicle protein
MAEESGDHGAKVLWFIAGAAVGASIALLYAPASGEHTRKYIGERAQEGRDALAEKGQVLVDRGRDLYERGRRIADDAAGMFERGKQIIDKAAESAGNLQG